MDDAELRGDGVPTITTPAAVGCRAIVIIPVRDEEATLQATLGSLAAQLDPEGRPLPRHQFEVIILANNCRDDSAGIVRRFAARDPSLALHLVELELPSAVAHVGTARRWLMDEACRRLLAAGNPRGLIASTDGDTRVAPNWLAETWAEVARGADAVGGDIRTDRVGRSALGNLALRSYLQDVCYRRLLDELASRLDPDTRDPWPRHHHHTGASLAITAEAYRTVGGLPPLRSSEDLALVAAVRRFDLGLRHAPKVRVVTSTRRLGRATGGMADTLRDWSGASGDLQVESPRASEARFTRTRKLRGLWRSSQLGGPRSTVPVDLDMGLDLKSLIAKSDSFGSVLETVESLSPLAFAATRQYVPIDRAIADLRKRLSTLRPVTPTVPSVADFLEQVDPVCGFPSPLPVF